MEPNQKGIPLLYMRKLIRYLFVKEDTVFSKFVKKHLKKREK